MRLVMRVLAVVVGSIALVLLFFFLLWLQGDTRTGYEPSPTLLNEVGIWGERLYLVESGARSRDCSSADHGEDVEARNHEARWFARSAVTLAASGGGTDAQSPACLGVNSGTRRR